MRECAINVYRASVQTLDVEYANDLGREYGAMTRNATDVRSSDVQSVARANASCAAYVIVCIGTRNSALDVNRSRVQNARRYVLANAHTL